MNGAGGEGRWAGAVAWGVLSALLVGTAGLVLVLGLARMGQTGPRETVVISACESSKTGRATGYVQCTGRLPDGSEVSVRHDGRPGESITAGRAPWGSYLVPDSGPLSWAMVLPAPPALLAAAYYCARPVLRPARRVGRRRSPCALPR